MDSPALATATEKSNLATGLEYDCGSISTKVASLNPVQDFISPVGHPYSVGVSYMPPYDLVNSFYPRTVNDGWGRPSQAQSGMYPQCPDTVPDPASVPLQPIPLQIPVHHMVTHALPPMHNYPSFPTPTGYYHSGVPSPSTDRHYSCGLYRASDVASTTAPSTLNAVIPMYAGIPPPDPHQQPPFYEFNGAAPPPPLRYIMAPMQCCPPPPVSPGQTNMPSGIPAQAQSDGKIHAQVRLFFEAAYLVVIAERLSSNTHCSGSSSLKTSGM